jgi:predicted O-methyltransferase YrrM
MQLRNVTQSSFERLLARIIYVFSLRRVDFRAEKQIRQLRVKLGEQVYSKLNGTVLQGPFEGMRLHSYLSWGQTSLAGKLLGTYEKGVVENLSRVLREYEIDTVVNLGAADGYLAIGAGINKRVKRLVCYEINEQSHKILTENASLNGIQHKLEIHNEATEATVSSLDLSQSNAALFVIDIEGAEFDLITPTLLKYIANNSLIIELHDATSPKAKKLKELLQKYYNVKEIAQDNCISSIEFLKQYSDLERALIRIEGRHYEGIWLICEPCNNV